MKLKISILTGIALVFETGIADNTISTTLPDGREIQIEAFTDNILRISNRASGEAIAESRTLVRPNGSAHTSTSETDGKLLLSTASGLSAQLDKTTGELHVADRNGNGFYDNGQRSTDSRGRRSLRLLPNHDSRAFYGAGERGHALNLAGDTLVMYNRQNYGYTDGDARINQMNITMPLLLSPEGYAVVFDDYAEAELIAGHPVEYATHSPSPVTYYYISSPNGFAGLTKQVSDLTGRQDLPPFWSLGYITSKYGYKTQAETDSVIHMLKANGYPVDGIVLDLYWYGKEQDMGRLEWDREQWPDPQAMLAALKENGVNLIAISQPYVLRNGLGLDNFNYLSERGMLARDSVGRTKDVEIWVGEGGMLDVSNPDTRLWLRNRYRTLTDGGITGWWGDLGEPEVHPDGMYHANGLSNRLYHNLYGNDWSSIIYDLFAEEYPDTRLMTMMRGGTVGLQRYSVFPWSTDVSRSWGGLQPQIKIMLNSGLSGMGYMSHDVGGFAIDPEHPYDPELYVRWLQLGTFSPILRTHAQDFAEPFLYPDQQDIILPLIKERYRWLPYNYTLAYENATQGLPLVRPVGMYTSDPGRYSDVTDEYLWGRDVLVAPVLEAGAATRRVRLPEGLWVNVGNPAQVLRGDTTVVVEAPLNVLPMFVRAGALIPKADYEMANTLQYDPSRLTVDYYPVVPEKAGETLQSSFTLFDDDRTSTHTIERNDFTLTHFTAQTTVETTRLTVAAEGSYPGMPTQRIITYRIHNTEPPRSIKATQTLPDGHASDVDTTHTYNPTTRTLTVSIPLRVDSSTTLLITR